MRISLEHPFNRFHPIPFRRFGFPRVAGSRGFARGTPSRALIQTQEPLAKARADPYLLQRRERVQPMSQNHFTFLGNRGLLTITGPDSRNFLQGLISNDVNKVSPEQAIYAAMLSAHGKFLHDFFIFQQGEALVLDCEAERLADLLRRLGMYKLRSQVTIAPGDTDRLVAVAFGEDAPAIFGLAAEAGRAVDFAGGTAFIDPRLPDLGVRLVGPVSGLAEKLQGLDLSPAEPADYDRLRLELGIADGSRDLQIDRTLLLEAGFDELNGVDWKKGCYVGQEMTARTKYRALVKKRLMPVRCDGAVPTAGSPVTLCGREAGEICSGRDSVALAVLRLDMVEEAAASGQPLVAEGIPLHPVKPEWARF
jgi:tRNA-modifying protein YgfZ